MEIANLLQPMGMDPSAAVAAAGAPAQTAPAPDGAFALFFAQVMNTALMTVSAEVKPELQGKPVAESKGEEQSLQETGPEEKQSVVPAELAAELQALAFVNTAPQPAPAAPVQSTPEEGGQVTAVSAGKVPETTQQATPAPVVVSQSVAEGKHPEAPAVPESAFVPAQARPVAAATVPATAERGPVEIAALPAQKEPASVKDGKEVPALPVPETEGSPATVMTVAQAVAPVEEAQAPERTAIAAKAAPAGEAGMTRKPAHEAGKQPAEHPANVEETVETVTAKQETTEIRNAVRKPTMPDQANHEQAEQHLASHGKEMPAQPVTVASQAVRETEAARQSAPATPETPLPGHEHIMQQVKEKLEAHSYKGGNDQISFTLHPEELGELKIVMKMNDQRLKVEIVAQNQTVREALMQNLEGLKETLSRQNITVDRFDVNTGGGSFNQAFHEGRQTGRDRYFQQHPRFTGGSNEPEQKAIVTAWLPRENSLVDVRF